MAKNDSIAFYVKDLQLGGADVVGYCVPDRLNQPHVIF